jgi:two-component system, NarL family, response regulator YdfI
VIRLLIAAPAAVVRAGLEALAASNPHVQLMGAFDDLASVEALRPDVVLAALPLSDLSPPANGHTPAYVLLSEAPWTTGAIRLGVRAILPRDASAAEIMAAIEAAAAGLAVIRPDDLALLVPTPVSAEPSNLTPRELEVLRWMADGAANKAIAFALDISEHTVKFHVASVLSKLNAGSRTEAVAIGLRKGLVML